MGDHAPGQGGQRVGKVGALPGDPVGHGQGLRGDLAVAGDGRLGEPVGAGDRQEVASGRAERDDLARLPADRLHHVKSRGVHDRRVPRGVTGDDPRGEPDGVSQQLPRDPRLPGLEHLRRHLGEGRHLCPQFIRGGDLGGGDSAVSQLDRTHAAGDENLPGDQHVVLPRLGGGRPHLDAGSLLVRAGHHPQVAVDGIRGGGAGDGHAADRTFQRIRGRLTGGGRGVLRGLDLLGQSLLRRVDLSLGGVQLGLGSGRLKGDLPRRARGTRLASLRERCWAHHLVDAARPILEADALRADRGHAAVSRGHDLTHRVIRRQLDAHHAAVEDVEDTASGPRTRLAAAAVGGLLAGDGGALGRLAVDPQVRSHHASSSISTRICPPGLSTGRL